MLRKYGPLAIVLVVALTMGIAATASSGATFNVEAAPTTLTGAQEGTNTIVTDSGTIHCKTAAYEGTVSTTSAAELTLTPEYKECTLTGASEVSVTVHANGCKWTYETAETATTAVRLSGCTEGTSGIVFTAPSCTITLLTQFTTMGPVHYLNTGSGATREVKIESTIENLTYTELGPSCKNTGAHTTGGKITGKIALTGENAETKVHRGVWFTPSAPPSKELHSETASTTLSGAQTSTNTLSFDSGIWHCTTMTYSGTLSSKTSSDVLLTPVWSGCQTTGFIEATGSIDMNGCKYTVTPTDGVVHLTGCSAGSAGIVMTLPFCTITLKEQTMEKASFTNEGAGTTREISMEWGITNLAYTEKGFACKNTEASTTGGAITGKVRITGTSGGSHAGIWAE